MFEFIENCDDNWKRLLDAIMDQVGESVGQEVSRTNTDGADYVTLLFVGYGEAVNVPIGQLVEVNN